MVYDRADWHYGGNFPKDIPPENGATHIGMFLAWAIMNNLEGEIHRTGSLESLKLVREKKMTGREFLLKECDEKFWEEDLNEEGNKFAQHYYAHGQKYGLYLTDYEKSLSAGLPSLYHVSDSWDNFEKIRMVIDKRYRKWKTGKTKKWWQFWK